jgi:AraC-like DNA-binding protein
MPPNAVHTYADPDDYAASVRASKITLTALGRGRFDARITRITLPRLWMQRFSESLPRILHSAGSAERAIVSFSTQPGPSLIRGGVELGADSIARMGLGQSYFQRSSGPVGWASMSLPIDELRALGPAIAGCDLTPPFHGLIITPPKQAMARLKCLHATAGFLAENAPEIIASQAVSRGLEQALIEAMLACVAAPAVTSAAPAHGRRELIMRRFHQVLQDRPDEAVYIADICVLIGVPERTLQLCCQETLGMGPKRYLVLRRLVQARKALSRADPAVTTVTEIATSLGFWHLGRFAVEYRRLHGETPSATFHRPP